jgi:opacity protein-like surface antigen
LLHEFFKNNLNQKKMKTKGLAFIMLVLLSMSSFAQESEKRFGLELNSGASFATKKIDGASLNPGFGLEFTLHFRFLSHLGVYAGWGWNRFGADESFAGNDVCFEETGYVLGLNFKHPIGNSKLAFYVRAGGLYNHIETENADGDIIHDSKHGFGYQLAGGLDINLGKNWSLTPGLKFNSLARETDFEGTPAKLDYQYVSVRIGIAKKF